MEKKKNTPKLRFPEFTGEWEIDTIEKICDKTISYGIVQTGDVIENGIPCVRVIDLANDVLDVSKMITTSYEINNSYKKTILEIDDIIFALRGVIGKVIKTTPELIGSNITRGVARISCNKKLVLPDYMLWAIRSPNFVEEINKRVNGSALQEIPLSNLRVIPLSFPTLLEQTKIATFLTAVDEKLTQLKKKKTLLEQYKKGVMQKLFSQELRFKDDNNQDFPDWQEKQLGELGDIVTGSTPPTANGEYYNGNFSFVSPYDINEKRFVEKTKTTLTELGFLKGRKIRTGSSLFVCIGSTIGKVAQSSIDCITNQQINSVIPYENYNDDFIYTLLENHSHKIKILAAEQAVPIINKTTFSNYNVFVPSLPEQQKIATFFSAIDEKISHSSTQIEKMEAWKKGLLQQMFI
jgi:type I restriction enzyme S subunit